MKVKEKWKTFERLVGAINAAEQRGAVVKWSEKINGRQFDVTVRFKHGLYEFLTVVECKDHSKPVPAEKVDALVTKARDAGADKAVMVAASGFQAGAVEVARRHNVQLFTLKTLAETPEGKLTDELTPVLCVFGFRFQEADSNGVIAIPEETGILRMSLRDNKIQGPSIDTTPEQVIDDVLDRVTQLATAMPQRFEVKYPVGTVLVHSNTGVRVPISTFSFHFCLVAVSELLTTEGLGVDRYLSGSIYKLEEPLASEARTIDTSKLRHGFDTTLMPGKYYINPNLQFSYYCQAVIEDLATMVLVESYQLRNLIQVTFAIQQDWWSQFVEITNEAEIERLHQMYEAYLNYPRPNPSDEK